MLLDVYIACLSNAVLHRRAALQIELSVGLCVAHDLSADPVQARVTLTQIYASAGYDCLTPDGRDYKTINRRVNAAFALSEHVDISDAVRSSNGHRRIEAVQSVLEPLQLYHLSDVLAFCGRPASTPRERPAAEAPTLGRRAVDAPDVVHVRTEHIDLPLPPNTTRVEIMQLVHQLLELADTFHGKRAGRRAPRKAVMS